MTNDQASGAAERSILEQIITTAVAPRGLVSRTDLTVPDWTFWELRTLNRHRVVALFEPRRGFRNAQELDDDVRGVLSRQFPPSWWRGIAYGVIVDVTTVSLSPEDLKTLVDVRENSRGDVQWVVLAAIDRRVAVGVHTWIEAYLSPPYRSVLLSLQSAGCRITSVKREKDGLMKFLTGIADLDVAIHSFGQRIAFPEFQNDLPTTASPSAIRDTARADLR